MGLFTTKHGRVVVSDGRDIPDPANTDIYFYDDSAGTYTSKKFDLINPYPAWAGLADSADRLVLGLTRPFGRVFLGVADYAIGAGRMVVEYYNGSTWTALTHYSNGMFYPERVVDGTVGSIGVELTESSNLIANGGGGWKSAHVRHPSVVFRDGIFHMVYQGYNSSVYRIGYATSTDGVTFSESASNPVFSDGTAAKNPRLVWHDNQWKMYYLNSSNLICMASGGSIGSLAASSVSPVIGALGFMSTYASSFSAHVVDGIVRLNVSGDTAFESEDGVYFNSVGSASRLYNPSSEYIHSCVEKDGVVYAVKQEAQSSKWVVTIKNAPDSFYFSRANAGDSGGGSPYAIVRDATATNDKEHGAALFANGRLYVYYTHNANDSIRVAVSDVLNNKQSTLVQPGYLSFKVPSNWAKQGHASLSSSKYYIRIGTENTPTVAPSLWSAYPVTGQEKTIEFDGDFSGPIGPKTFDEKLVFPRGYMGEERCYVPGTDDVMAEPVDISFSGKITDGSGVEFVNLLAGKNPYDTSEDFVRFPFSTKGQGDSFSIGRYLKGAIVPDVWTDLRLAMFIGQNDFYDYSGKRCDFALGTEPAFVQFGEHGLYAADFESGSGHNLSRANFGSAGENVRFNGEFSASVWVKVESLAADVVIAAKSGNTNRGWIFKIESDGAVTVRIGDATNYIQTASSASTVTTATWTHLAFTWDGSTAASGINIYKNGFVISSSDTSGGTFTAIPATSIATTVGCSLEGGGDAGNEYFDGLMFRLQLGAEELTAAKVSRLFANEWSLLHNNDAASGHVIEAGESAYGFTAFGSVSHDMRNNFRGGWLFNAANAEDIYGSLDLTNNNAVTFDNIATVGQHGVFNGTSQYLSLANTGSSGENVRFTGAFTMCAWVYLDDLGSNAVIFAKAGETNRAYSVWVDTTGYVGFDLYTGTTSNSLLYKTAAGVIEAARWYHVIVSWDGTTTSSGMAVYVDGVSKALTDNSSQGAFTGVSDVAIGFTIGAAYDGAGDAAGGLFDGRIWRVMAKSGTISSFVATEIYENEKRQIEDNWAAKFIDKKNPLFSEDKDEFEFINRDRGWGGSIIEIGFSPQTSLLEVNQTTVSSVIGEVGGTSAKSNAVGQTYTPSSGHWLYNASFSILGNGTLPNTASLIASVYKRNDPLSASYLVAKSLPVNFNAVPTAKTQVVFVFPVRVWLESGVEHVIRLEPIGHSASDTNYIDVYGSSSSAISGIAIKYDASGNETTTTADLGIALNEVTSTSITGQGFQTANMATANIVRGIRFPAFEFNGTDEGMVCPSTSLSGASLRYAGAFSVSAWINVDSVSGTKTIISKFGNASGDRAFKLYLSGAKPYLQVVGTGAGTFTTYAASNQFVADTWYHIVATYDASTSYTASDTIKIYVNGALVSEDGSSGSSGTFTAYNGAVNFPWSIGFDKSGSADAAANFFDGTIAELMVLPFELTQAQVSKIYSRTARTLNGIGKVAFDVWAEWRDAANQSHAQYYGEVHFEPSSQSISETSDGAEISVVGKSCGRRFPVGAAGRWVGRK